MFATTASFTSSHVPVILIWSAVIVVFVVSPPFTVPHVRAASSEAPLAQVTLNSQHTSIAAVPLV